MRYDQTVYLIKEGYEEDGLNERVTQTFTMVKANVKRANLTFGDGSIYDTTIVRVFGEYDADKLVFANYDPSDVSTTHEIQQISRHFNRTDFYIINSEVIFHG